MSRETCAAEPPASNRSIEIAEHVKRVAAFAAELAIASGMDVRTRELLRDAALSHHYPPILLHPAAKPRLLADLRICDTAGSQVRPEVAEILLALHFGAPPSSPALRLAAIVEQANALDEWMEAEPFRTVDEEIRPDGLAATAASRLRATADMQIEDALDDLPVMPRVAQQVLNLLRSDRWSSTEIERLASSDPVLAGHLIQCANSAAFGPSRPISTVGRAILQLGTDAAIRLLIAASLKPAFASPPLYRLWNHSLVAAGVAQQLAELVGEVDPLEAFLAGLVHDIGRLPMLDFGHAFQTRLARTLENGCDLVSAEVSLCGRSHADIGALITDRWRFPEQLSAAVKNHHRPEVRDRMAAILYLVEDYSNAREHRPSGLRRYLALETVDAPEDILNRISTESMTHLNALKFAA
jgi:putative nucleotidyltransferase with HDIG domain